MTKKFLRRVWHQYSKLGKRKKKKQVWRNPTGRHNKMRKCKKGVPPVVSIGYSTSRKDLNRIKGKLLLRVDNLKDLKKVGKDNVAVLGKMGIKKKLEIAQNSGTIEFANFNAKKFLKEHGKSKELNSNSGEKK